MPVDEAHRETLLRVGAAGLVGIAAFTVSILLLLFGPLSVVSLNLRMTSTIEGYSQLFFADTENAFTETASVVEPVSNGVNDIHFVLAGLNGSDDVFLRWDPLDRAADLTLQDPYFSVGPIRQALGIEDFTPSVDVTRLVVQEGGASLSTLSHDGQVLVRSAYRDALDKYRTGSLAASLLVAITATVLWGFTRQRRGRPVHPARVDPEGSRRSWPSYIPQPVTVLVVTLGVALVFLASWALAGG